MYAARLRLFAGHRAIARSAYQRYLQLSPKGRYAGDVRAVLGSF